MPTKAKPKPRKVKPKPKPRKPAPKPKPKKIAAPKPYNKPRRRKQNGSGVVSWIRENPRKVAALVLGAGAGVAAAVLNSKRDKTTTFRGSHGWNGHITSSQHTRPVQFGNFSQGAEMDAWFAEQMRQ